MHLPLADYLDKEMESIACYVRSDFVVKVNGNSGHNSRSYSTGSGDSLVSNEYLLSRTRLAV